ncbi:heme-binding domain-containing protein [Mucilaginibacter sp. UR6-1]|uniref:heme-binding domain-containing protein n=1 Tax=Mucilaginibacter sp. UR6-1 TaxID=1435643 RepID=UPI001E41E099|nr:heme-binding domain-containing protein [Mucilaginibacter sp. UR6-1]MCC8407770.1 heme-binding domain-containing protein [Mucilaginibacter sp. UR6-1]
MNSAVKMILSMAAVILVVIQFLPRAHNEGRIVPANDINGVLDVPGNVQVVLKTACYDCHSNNTRYPAYAMIQPVRMMLDRHVAEGKKNLNFNDFATYSARKQNSKLRAIAESLDEGTMPLASYTLIHRNAILSVKEKALLQNWVKRSAERLLLKQQK